MASYILFSQTSTAGFNRSTWGPGLGGTGGGISAPGNPDLSSAFNADLLTPAQLLAGNAKFFDVSSGTNAALAAFGSGGGGTPLFAPAVNTTLASNAVGGGVIDLSQSDANWNGIKNIEIRLDSLSDIRTVLIANIVDTRIKLGDDVRELTAEGADGTPFAVALLGVKRGEVDATLATAPLHLQIDVWSNTAVGQNSFDIKGSVYDDLVVIGAGKVVGSVFGNKSGQTGYDGDGTYDGTFTKTFTNLGAGDDIFDSTNLAGDTLTGKVFKTVDKTWGGTGDDIISTGFGADKIFGDNGSAANAYADPADLVPTPGAPGDDQLWAGGGADFLEGNQDNGGIILATEVCLDFILGAPLSGTSEDTGFLLIESIGGDLAKLGDGATFGGLTVHSPSDQALAGGTDFFTNEIDAFKENVLTAEGVRFTFDGPGVTGFHIDLNLFFADTFFEEEPEFADFKVTLEDGSEVIGLLEATSTTDPGAFQFAFGLGDSGGELITGFEISAHRAPRDPVSEFTIAEFCYDGQLTIAGGDLLFLGDDADKDTVNFNDGDGVDTVFEFDTAKDCVRIEGNEARTLTVVVDAANGVGTLIEHGADGDAIFLVGVVDTAAIQIITF